MTISSRTPEGQPVSCPLCGANVVVEPSVLIGDAPCPNCGQLLWYFQSSETLAIFDELQEIPSKNRILGLIATRLGVERDTILNNPSLMNDLGVDSLDTVELVMALEEEFDS